MGLNQIASLLLVLSSFLLSYIYIVTYVTILVKSYNKAKTTPSGVVF